MVVLLQGHANPTAETETEEMDFLDMVAGEGNVLIQTQSVDAVNAEARAQGLVFPVLGYWSVEGHCFVKPAPGNCNGVLKHKGRSAVCDTGAGGTRLSTRNGEKSTRLPATRPAVTTTAAKTSKPSDVLACMARACAAGLPMARPCLAFNVCEKKESVDTSTVEPGELRQSS